jgi:hypothetical protein
MGRQINDFRPTATGLALALKLKKKKAILISFKAM